MSRIFKASSSLVVSACLGFLLTTSAFAAPVSNSPSALPATSSSIIVDPNAPNTKFEAKSEIPAELQRSVEKGVKGSVTITDKQKLKKIALEQGLSSVPDRIEYEFTPAPTATSTSPRLAESSSLPTVAQSSVYWATSTDKGSGWYYENSPYRTFIIDGPDTFVYSETAHYTTGWSGTFGAPASVITAQVGFSSGQDRSVSFTSNTPITATQRLTAKLYETYHKVAYSVFYGDKGSVNTSVCTGAGEAWEANGTMIQKTFTTK